MSRRRLIQILFYASIAAVSLLVLEGLKFRHLFFDQKLEFTLAMVALFFVAIGFLLGRLSKRNSKLEREEKNQIVDKLGLSDREMDVLRCMHEGLSNREIAEKLFISLSTVKSHSSNLFSKLGVARRTQAVALARELFLFVD